MNNCSIGALPSSYADSMSYYDAITFIHEYINNTIIPSINNNADITDEIKKNIIELNKKCEEIIEYFNSHIIPTKTSELENDSGYITSQDIPVIPTKTSDLTNDSGFITENSIPTEISSFNNDVGYITTQDIPSIPTKTSDLTNDSGFIDKTVDNLANYYNIDAVDDLLSTKAEGIIFDNINTIQLSNENGDSIGNAITLPIPTKTSELENNSGYLTSNDIPSIPTKTSDLENDSGFITISDVKNDIIYRDSSVTVNVPSKVGSYTSFTIPTVDDYTCIAVSIIDISGSYSAWLLTSIMMSGYIALYNPSDVTTNNTIYYRCIYKKN